MRPFDDFVEIDEVEVVKFARRQPVVERLHHAPRAVAYAHHDDRDRPHRGCHDGVPRTHLVHDLTVGDDHQNVVL